LFFSIPGIAIGLLICFFLSIPVMYIIAKYAYASVLDYNFTLSALLLGLLAGLILPLVGSVAPIRRALSSTLRDALDLYHLSSRNAIVTIQRLEDIGVSLYLTLFALCLAGIGFMVYYVVPLSFLFQELQIFFRILTIILLGTRCAFFPCASDDGRRK
jgi:hypothetical protein